MSRKEVQKIDIHKHTHPEFRSNIQIPVQRAKAAKLAKLAKLKPDSGCI